MAIKQFLTFIGLIHLDTSMQTLAIGPLSPLLGHTQVASFGVFLLAPMPHRKYYLWAGLSYLTSPNKYRDLDSESSALSTKPLVI